MHDVALPDWAIERGRALNDVRMLDPARTALVIVDMQNLFMAPDEAFGNAHALDIVAAVNRAAALVRAAGGRVIWTRQTIATEPPLAMTAWQYDLGIPFVRRAVETMAAGTRSHAIHDAMAVAPDDVILDKYRYGAFSCPAGALRATIEEAGVDTLVIAGTLTNCCCDSMAREAKMAGYRVLMLADATAARTDEEHNAALLLLRLNFADVQDVRTLAVLLGGTGGLEHTARHDMEPIWRPLR